MKKKPSRIDSSDGALALKLFDKFFPQSSWATWRIWLKSIFGLALSEDEAATFRLCTGRVTSPNAPAREVWVVAGRRSGKSRMAAFLATFLAAVRHYSLAPGEKGVVFVVAPGRRQATVIVEYTAAFLSMIPGVTIARRTADEIELSTGIVVAVQTASFRTPRGFTCVGAIVDEIAFLRSDDAANPDQEIIRALRPSLATVRGSLLLGISSPYAQRGILFETHQRHYGVESDTLVWQAATTTMNPTIDRGLVDQALDEDPESASAEWLALFRRDLEALFRREAVDSVIARDRYELAPMPGFAYVGFVDPSGGSADSFTLAIAHRDAMGRPVLDLIREKRPPFSPEGVCKEFAAELKRYCCRGVFSDLYAAEWPREQFAKRGITVEPSPMTRSELYLEMVPMVNSGGCELLDDPRFYGQLVNLQRRTGRTGKDSVDHLPGGHDDVANAACGAMVMCVQAIGLRANLPAEFTLCVNSEATAAKNCVFLMTGARFPSDPHCARHCSGYRAVQPAYLRHQQAAIATGQPVLTPLQFVEERFVPNSFTEPILWRRLMRETERRFFLR